jgi:hypothetical protein
MKFSHTVFQCHSTGMPLKAANMQHNTIHYLLYDCAAAACRAVLGAH